MSRTVSALVVVTLGMWSLAGSALAADPVVVAAGDLACSTSDPNYNSGLGSLSATYPRDSCLQQSVSDTALATQPAAFLTLGDNENGPAPNYSDTTSLADFQNVYAPSFGRLNSVVYPEVGNADYSGSPLSDSGYTQYFTNAGVISRIQKDGGNNTNLSKMYYSFNIASWHVIALNTECSALTGPKPGDGGCGSGSLEDKWLRADLAAHPGVCTLAYWHVPLWNSSNQGRGNQGLQFWKDLYAAHADVILNAHGNNHYEDFVPLSPTGTAPYGTADTTGNGIHQFIVSNGGYSHGSPNAAGQTTSAINFTDMGALELTLHPTSYNWQFLPASGGTFSDSGSANCHETTTPPPSFPTTPVLDSFAQAPGPLSSNWQSPALQDAGKMTVPASGQTSSGSGTSSATWTASSFGANEQAYLTVPKLPVSGDFIQVGGRVSSLTGSKVSLYFVRVTPSKSLWDLRKKLSGGGSTSMGTFTAPFAAGDSLGLELNGSKITAWHQAGGGAWHSVGSVTDTSITAGGYLTYTLGDTTARGGPFGGGNGS